MNEKNSSKEKTSGLAYVVARVVALLGVAMMFFPLFNPAYVFTNVDGTPIKNTTSLFTAAVSRGSIFTSTVNGAITKGLLDGDKLNTIYIACLLIFLAIIVVGGAACVSVGNLRFKRLANILFVLGGALMIGGAFIALNFNKNIDDIVLAKEVEADSSKVFSATLEELTGKQTKTVILPSEYSGKVYVLSISNGSGDNLTGWAVQIKVGDSFTKDNIEFVNHYYKLAEKKNATENEYSIEVNDGVLEIMPQYYSMADGSLTLADGQDASKIADASIAAGSSIKLVIITDSMPENPEIEVTDGSADSSFEFNDISVVCYLYMAVAIIIMLIGLLSFVLVPAPETNMPYEIETKYQLFLMFMPFLLLIFAFSYMPLYGWRYAFMMDANKGLTSENFAGFYWFEQLFGKQEYRDRFFRVMTNTLAMSGLGLLTSWLPMAFAIMLNEVKNTKFRRFVQTFSTIPNFISWVLVYAIAFSLFASDGMINNIFGGSTDMLADNSHMWLKMLAWGTWKGIGWSAIIYISGIAGIDQQLYEAASIDGADRFQRMWHITLPGLLPTYVVMLVMSIAGILSNGMDQYLVFSNAQTREPLEVLDLYVYNLGIGSNLIPLSTVIGMGKSVISIVLFFVANTAAKKIRGNGIV